MNLMKQAKKIALHRNYNQDAIKQIALGILVYTPAWPQNLSMGEAVKIRKKTSGLPASIIIYNNPDTGRHEIQVKLSTVTAQGSYKKVRFPVEWTSGQQTAVFGSLHKHLRSDPNAVRELQREGVFHNTLSNCQYVVRARVVKVTQWDPAQSRPVTSWVIRAEYMNMGTAEAKIGRCSDKEMKQIMLGTARGLNEMHKHPEQIVHNDIKPANILLHRMADGSILAKLTDLGFAEATQGTKPHHSSQGSPIFNSPEKRFTEQKGDSKSDDIWALGISWYLLKHGHYPGTLNSAQTVQQLDTILYTNRERIRGIEPQKRTLDHLIWQMLDPNPNKRPRSDQLEQFISNSV